MLKVFGQGVNTGSIPKLDWHICKQACSYHAQCLPCSDDISHNFAECSNPVDGEAGCKFGTVGLGHWAKEHKV